MEDKNPTYSQEEINEFIKAFWKRQNEDQAPKTLAGRGEKKFNSRQRRSFVEKTKARSSEDGARKRLPSSRRSNLKHFTKSSQRSPEYSQRRKGSPPTGRPLQSSPRIQPHSSNSSSSDSHESPHFRNPKHSDLRSMWPEKSPLQRKTDRYKRNKSCKSQALERSDSLEMGDSHKFSKSKPRAQRSSYDRCILHSCCCRAYDLFSSSENECHYNSSHRSRPLHRHKGGSQKGPHSQGSHSDRRCYMRRETHSAQKYSGHHKGHKRYRSPCFGRGSWYRSPSNDVQENQFEEDLAREIKRQKTGSDKKHKIPLNEIWRSPTLERGSLSRYSSKKVAPRESFKDKAGKKHKTNCPVGKDYNKRMCEEFMKTMKMRKDIEKWIMSNGEGNSRTRSPKLVRRASSFDVAIENNLPWQTESQEVISKEKVSLAEDPSKRTDDTLMEGVAIVKDPVFDIISPEVTSPESANCIEKEPIQETDSDEVTLTEILAIEKDPVRDIEPGEYFLIEAGIEEDPVADTESAEATLMETAGIDEDPVRDTESEEVILIESTLIEKDPVGDTESGQATLMETAGIGEHPFKDTESAEATLMETAEIKEDPFRDTESEEVILIESTLIEKDSVRDTESAELTLLEAICMEKDLVNDTGSRKIRPVDNVVLQKDHQKRKKIMPSTFFCNLCQLQLNSEVTWSTHIVGRRHARKMQAQTVYEIAKGSLPVLATPSIISDDNSRFANPPPGKKRRLTRYIARLQSTIDEIRREPVAGLEYVHEIIYPMDVDYYCTLCDALCKAASIMPHLIGFKHRLRVVRELFPGYYNLIEGRQDKDFRKEIERMLWKYEKKCGRGSIKVFREDDDPNTISSYNQNGPSYRNHNLPCIKKKPNDEGKEKSSDSYLDMSKGDFFCKLCDSHMNNQNMWEQHLRGRRHLENVKKVPGENISKVRSIKLPGVVSKLEKIIDNEASDELIVGLDYIRETRGPAGEIYNCFLCGSCSTNYDIIEHLLLLKHRTKYLEQLNVEGKSNVIEEIQNLQLRESSRDSLTTYQCYKLVEDFGRGKVEVYKSKS